MIEVVNMNLTQLIFNYIDQDWEQLYLIKSKELFQIGKEDPNLNNFYLNKFFKYIKEPIQSHLINAIVAYVFYAEKFEKQYFKKDILKSHLDASNSLIEKMITKPKKIIVNPYQVQSLVYLMTQYIKENDLSLNQRTINRYQEIQSKLK